MSGNDRVMMGVRTAITVFVLLLIMVSVLGWIWTDNHQPPPLRTASHVVLALSLLAGVFALFKIWRRDPPRTGT